MTFITFLRKFESFIDTHQLIMRKIKIVRTVCPKILGFKPILGNIKRLLKYHGNFLDSYGFQTYFSQYRTALNKV
jgi:hypothetical protein